MKFNFIREDGQTEEINVTCFIGRYESEAGYLNNLLKAEVQPISFVRLPEEFLMHVNSMHNSNITMVER